VNVVGGNFERNEGVGVIVTAAPWCASKVVSSSHMEDPAIVAQNIRGLTLRSNYFEENNRYANITDHFRFVSNGNETIPVCTDMLLTGALGWHWQPQRSALHGGLVVGELPLSNERPNSGVVIESNYHNPGGDRCPGPVFAGTFAAGAVGLRVEASDCSGCQHEDLQRTCVPVATGPPPHANSSLRLARISLNTGDFATVKQYSTD
jgi:hypothetical protein